MNTEVIVCSFLLQAIALAGAITLALVYDGSFTYLAFAIIGSVIGINIASVVRRPPTPPSWRP